MNQLIIPAVLVLARCVYAAADPAEAALDRLKRIVAAPPRLSPELKARVVALLPKAGEIKALTTAERQKLAALAPILNVHGRENEYLLKVVESRRARLAIHARFVLLITDTALRVLSPEQLRALVAHEIGHEYVWDEYEQAHRTGDWARVRELELFCDGLAMFTLQRIGERPSTLIDALRIVDASDRSAGILPDPVRNSHPSVPDRARFGKKVGLLLRP